VLSAVAVPTLWDPVELFAHLAVWAGVPAVLVGVVVGLLGLYQVIKSWVGFARSSVDRGKSAGRKLRGMTSVHWRAAARLVVCSVLAVTFSYMLAVIADAVVRLAELEPNALFTPALMENTVVATQWSPAAVWTVIAGVGGIGLLGVACIADIKSLRKLISLLGITTCVVAWVAGVFLGIGALGGFLLRLVHDPDIPVASFLLTELATALLLIAVALLLPRIRRATGAAFDSV
jgi:hypothetical protein